MCSPLRFLVFCAPVALLSLPPVFAGDRPAPDTTVLPSGVVTSNTILPAALRPVTPIAPGAAPARLRPVQLTQVPVYGGLPSTVLSSWTEAREEETPKRRGRKIREDLLFALWGAGIGLAIGLIDGDNALEYTLAGGAVGYGLYDVGIAAGVAATQFRPAETRPAEAQILGAPLRGKLGQMLPRALGLAALGLAADRAAVGEDFAGGRGRARPMLQYTIRW